MLVNRFNVVLLTIGVWLLVGPAAMSATRIDGESEQAAASTDDKSAQMARRIDALVAEQWAGEHVAPAPAAGDSEFLRRAYLDLTGVIPRVSEVREFLADDRPDKRARLVDRLLASPRYATHMATTWRNRILPVGVDPARNREAIALQKWLRTRFARNLRYDNLVGELLLAIGGDELGPALYFQANDLQPEKLAGSAAELFMGVKLHCAQCHDHPYADWSQRDFWGFAAFFARVKARDEQGMMMSGRYRLIDADRGDVRLPDSEEIVAPKYPRGEAATDDEERSRRVQLALWLTSRDNDFFARAAVNWAWAHLFGRGLVESIDEIESPSPSPSPERGGGLNDSLPERGGKSEALNARLLRELADHFVDSGFNLRELWRTLASTRAYQLSGGDSTPQSARPELFARMLAKPMTPEQLYDSFAVLAPSDLGPERDGARSGDMASSLDEAPMRMEFVRRMRSPPGAATEFRAGTLQVLMLMNGRVAANVSDHDGSLLGAIDAPFMNDEDRIESLFLATLSRRPEADEQGACAQALAECKTADERGRAMSDILWALVNSTEFAFNH